MSVDERPPYVDEPPYDPTYDEPTTPTPEPTTPAPLDAEQAVLGAMLNNPNVIPDVTNTLQPADYAQPRHETIHDTIITLHNAGSHLAYVGVSTALLPIAERLAELTGTKVTTVRRNYNRLGCSSHCTEPHLHVDSVTARWSLTGARALTFLVAIRPFLGVKAEAADEVIEASKDAPSKARTTQKMASLGWPTELRRSAS